MREHNSWPPDDQLAETPYGASDRGWPSGADEAGQGKGGIMSTTIRIDPEVYRRLLEARAKLELSTGKVQSFNTTVAYLLTLAN